MASEDLWNSSSDEEDDEETEDVLFGVHHPASLHELLCFVPPRPIVDRTLSAYFSAKWLTFRKSSIPAKIA